MQNDSQQRGQLLRSSLRLPIPGALVQLIASFQNIAQVSFVVYKPAPGLDERLAKNEDASAEIREIAENLRQTYGIPFWDAILSICMKRGEVPDRYVDLAILHDRSPDERTISMESSQVSVEALEALRYDLKDGAALAFSSRVKLRSGQTAHIPLMDFRCNPSETNSRIVQRALRAMGQEAGLLAESGRSYHYYGFQLQSDAEWVQFLAMAMLFSPIVDVRYIAHRLTDGTCRLRISSGLGKSSIPLVCQVFP